MAAVEQPAQDPAPADRRRDRGRGGGRSGRRSGPLRTRTRVQGADRLTGRSCADPRCGRPPGSALPFSSALQQFGRQREGGDDGDSAQQAEDAAQTDRPPVAPTELVVVRDDHDAGGGGPAAGRAGCPAPFPMTSRVSGCSVSWPRAQARTITVSSSTTIAWRRVVKHLTPAGSQRSCWVSIVLRHRPTALRRPRTRHHARSTRFVVSECFSPCGAEPGYGRPSLTPGPSGARVRPQLAVGDRAGDAAVAGGGVHDDVPLDIDRTRRRGLRCGIPRRSTPSWQPSTR